MGRWKACVEHVADCWTLVVLVDDDFIRCLFDIIEDLSYDVTDPYHYPVIRVLVSSPWDLTAMEKTDPSYSWCSMSNS